MIVGGNGVIEVGTEEFYMCLKEFYAVCFAIQEWDVCETKRFGDEVQGIVLDRLEFDELCWGYSAQAGGAYVV